jgi:hypothetical protein
MTPNRSYLYQARYFLLVLIVLSGLVLLATMVWLSHPAMVSANSNDLASVEAKYPNIVGTRLDSCSLCHTSPPTLNVYGAAYLAAGRNTAAFAAIENVDSDKDGWTNIQEIMALTFPGDPNDHPAANSPTPTATTTRTSVPTETPVPTATSTQAATATSANAGGGQPTATKVVAPTKTAYPKLTGTPHTERTPRLTTTPRPERTPRPTRTPRVGPSPTPCNSGEGDDSFDSMDSGFRTFEMTHGHDSCYPGGRGGDD